MLMRLFVVLIVLLAVCVGIGASTVFFNSDQIIRVIYFRDFFETSLPILGFGALIKYLCTCGCSCKGCQK